MNELEAVTVNWRWSPIGDDPWESLLGLDRAGKLVFPSVRSKQPGVYRLLFLNHSRYDAYIGESADLRRRFQGYRTPHASQSTNIKVNKALVEHLIVGGAVEVEIAVGCHAALSFAGRDHLPLPLDKKANRVLFERAAEASAASAHHRLLNWSEPFDL